MNTQNQDLINQINKDLLKARKEREENYIQRIAMEERKVVYDYELSFLQDRFRSLQTAITGLGENQKDVGKIRTLTKIVNEKLKGYYDANHELQDKFYNVCEDGQDKDTNIKDL